MSVGGHNKGFPNYRKVECAPCGQHLCAKQIDDWIKYENGGRGYPDHDANTMEVKFYELNNGKAIKSRSIMSMFGRNDNEKSLVFFR